MATNVSKSLDLFKEVALLDSTRQTLLSSAAVLLQRLPELKRVFFDAHFEDAVRVYFDSVDTLQRILAENSSCKILFYEED